MKQLINAGNIAVYAETSPTRDCTVYTTYTPDQKYVVKAWRYEDNANTIYGAVYERNGKTVPFVQYGDDEPIYGGEFRDILGAVEFTIIALKKDLVGSATRGGGDDANEV